MSRFADRLARLLGVHPDSRVKRAQLAVEEAEGANRLLKQENAGVQTRLDITRRRLDDAQQKQAAAERAADRLRAEQDRADGTSERLGRIAAIVADLGTSRGDALARIQAVLDEGDGAGA